MDKGISNTEIEKFFSQGTKWKFKKKLYGRLFNGLNYKIY